MSINIIKSLYMREFDGYVSWKGVENFPERIIKYISTWNKLCEAGDLEFYINQGLDLPVFFRTMYDWVEGNEKKANKYKDWKRALKNWLNKALKDFKGQGGRYDTKKTNSRRCRKDGSVRI